jgi:signal transduction histidine kinase
VNQPQSDRRLSALIDAGLALAAELDLDTLLQEIADLSRDVIGAHYGAVGVLAEDETLANFLHSGIDDETVRMIGHLPEGHGLLGVIIEEGEPLRVAEIAEHPRSYGFPSHHPEMHSFLGVPIVARGRIFGRLYLAEKIGGGEFSKDDERLALVLAAQAGVAVENARLYGQVQERGEELAHRLAELSSVEVIGKLLLSESSAEEMLRLVAEEARALTDGARAVVALLDQDTDQLTIRVAVGDQFAADLLGTRLHPVTSKASAVINRLKSEAVEDLGQDPEVDADALGLAGNPRSGAFAPLVLKGRGVGVLAVFERSGGNGFSDDDLTILDMLAGMAAIGLENERLNQALRALAVLEERERISEDLHDGVIQSIYSVGLSLQGSVSLLERDPEAAKQRIDQSIAELDNVIRDVRGYIFELRPKIVEEVGVTEAVRGLVRELEINTLAHTEVDLHEEACEALTEKQQSHVVQIIREVLSNIARHAQATEVWVGCEAVKGEVMLTIEDDGVGFDPDNVSRGEGLGNMRERAARLGSTLEIIRRKPTGTIHRLSVSTVPKEGG